MSNTWTIDAATVKAVHPHTAELGECPLWSVTDQVLYFVDIARFAVHRFNPMTGDLTTWHAPEEPGCLALMSGGKLMVALRSGFATLDTHTGQWGEVQRVDHDTAQFRFNDGRCDAAGRFWAGTIFQPRTAANGALYCLDKGQVRRVLGPENGTGVKTSNGLALSDDGWLYHSDTPNHIVRRYPFDVTTGQVQIEGVQVFAQMQDTRPDPSYGGRPDGAAIDSEGHYWSAQFEGARVLRFAPDGRISGEVKVPAKRVTMVAFGGADLQTLYITTAREGATEADLAAYPQSGAVFAVQVPVKGRAEPLYKPE